MFHRGLLFSLAVSAGLFPPEGWTLTVGDPAPKLAVSKWVQGEPVDALQRDQAYLVEFWATWCGPCIAAIPHVNELHLKFKDQGLVIIGQNVLEDDVSAVTPFVKRMGNKMTYRVALDDTAEHADGAMVETWMHAAEQRGIPVSFVVDKQGLIAWIGHPMELKEELLTQVLAGTFDVQKAALKYAEEQKLQSQLRVLWTEYMGYRENKDWDQAEATLTRVENLVPEDYQDHLALTRFKLWLDMKSYEKAYELARRLSDVQPSKAMVLNELAWTIAIKEGIDRDLDLAANIARRAHLAASNNLEKAEILDTLARVLYLKGEKQDALKWQAQAVQFAEGERQEQFQKTLDEYRADRLPDPY